MALINCPECNGEVSDVAMKCPSCGVQLRKAKRSLFGKIIKWGFIAFNILMALWVFGGIDNAVDKSAGLTGAEAAGAAIGTGIGAMFLLTIWVIGDIILGLFVLFTRPKN